MKSSCSVVKMIICNLLAWTSLCYPATGRNRKRAMGHIKMLQMNLYYSIDCQEEYSHYYLLVQHPSTQEQVYWVCMASLWDGRGLQEWVASVRSCWELSPCLAEPKPVGSKMGLLQLKAEPISNGK